MVNMIGEKTSNSASAPELVRKLFNYFRGNLLVIGRSERVLVPGWAEDNSLLQQLSGLLSFVDTGIKTLTVQERDIESLRFPEEWTDEFKAAVRRDMKWKPMFSHETEGGRIEPFELSEESAGTLPLDVSPKMSAKDWKISSNRSKD